jgi:hypothetical protein
MRLLWPLLLIAVGAAILFRAVWLSERFDARWTGLREESPHPGLLTVERTKGLRERILTAVLRAVGLYVILAGTLGLFGILISK